MNEQAKPPKIERTPEQKADEKRNPEQHRRDPVLKVPANTIKGREVASLLRLIAQAQRLRKRTDCNEQEVSHEHPRAG